MQFTVPYLPLGLNKRRTCYFTALALWVRIIENPALKNMKFLFNIFWGYFWPPWYGSGSAFSVRIWIQSTLINAYPCGSGSTTQVVIFPAFARWFLYFPGVFWTYVFTFSNGLTAHDIFTFQIPLFCLRRRFQYRALRLLLILRQLRGNALIWFFKH
jgi:hypothetical protein